MKRILYCLLLMVCHLTFASPLEKLRYTTEDYPPFNYTHDNKIVGISIDLLDAVWEKLGVKKQKIELMPWARAYHDLQRKQNNVLFAVAKTESRTPLFQWACPIVKTRYVLIGLKAHNIEITDISQISEYNIGTIRYDVGEQELMGLFDVKANIVSNVSMKPNLALMEKGRVQLIAYDEVAAPGMLEEFGYNSDLYEVVFPIADSVTCFAFNNKQDEQLVKQFQDELKKVVKTPVYSEIINKHFPKQF